jgi:branched-chain amino acid transport system substrate-binding protein
MRRVAVAAVLLLAAWHLDAARADEAQGITPDTIKIGIIGPFTGPASDFSKNQIAQISYYNAINAQGGINGRKLELIVEDDACDEQKAIAAARKLIFDSKVFLLHAFTCSGAALAAKPVIVQSGIPWVVGGAAATTIATPVVRTIFQPTPTTLEVGHAMADFAMSKPGMKTIAVISHSNEWAKGYYDGLIKQLKDKYEITPVLDLTMERGSTDATPQLLQLRQAKPDAVMVILYPAESAIFLRDAKKYAYNAPFISTYGTSIEDQMKRLNDPVALKNFFTAFLVADIGTAPDMAKWRDIIHASYPSESITSVNLTGFGGALATVKALQDAGPSPTWDKFIDAMDKIKDFDTGVMAGPLTFTPTDHTGQKQLYFDTYVDGVPTVFTAWGKQR